jgi:hypothetical protein
MKLEEKYYRTQVALRLKSPLRAVAASKGITTRSLVTQILDRFIDSRSQLLKEIAQNNEKEGKEN